MLETDFSINETTNLHERAWMSFSSDSLGVFIRHGSRYIKARSCRFN